MHSTIHHVLRSNFTHKWGAVFVPHTLLQLMELKRVISIKGDVLLINEMYFDLSQVRFVDVVRVGYHFLRNVFIVIAVGCLALAFLSIFLFMPIITLTQALFAFAAFVISRLYKSQYALRVISDYGAVEAIISSDTVILEQYRKQIMEAIIKK